MTDDRGQALVFAVLILGLAAAAVSGLIGVEQRILAGVADERAGEAAAAAAGRVVADALFARTANGARHLSPGAIAEIAADPTVAEAARVAAVRLARLNGRTDPTDVSLHAYGYEIEAHLTLAGRQHIALLEPPP